MDKFKPGDKVTYKGDTYDFAYYSASPGVCILYEEGCRNMQDSFAVSCSLVTGERIMKFYKDDVKPEAALFDALIWTLAMEPSPCRCILDVNSLCRAHQALEIADNASVTSPHWREIV